MTPVGQTADGTWQLGVRRTVRLAPEKAWDRLGALLGERKHALEKGARFTAKDGATADVRSLTPGVVARFSFRSAPGADATTLQLRLMEAAKNTTTVAIHHEGLPNAAAREAMLERWTTALNAFGPADKP